MAVQYVAGQKISGGANGVTSTNVAMPSNVTAGNNVQVGVASLAQGRTLTVTDTLGNTYVKDKLKINTTGDKEVAIYTAKNIAGGACTITFGISGAASRLGMSAREFSGEDITTPLDTTAEGNGTDTSVECGSVVMTANGAIVTVHGTPNSRTTTLDTDYAELSENTTGRIAMGHRITSAITDQAIHTLSSNDNWCAVAAAYKEASAGGADVRRKIIPAYMAVNP